MDATNKLLLEDGYGFHKNGDLNQAEVCYEKFLENEPNNFNVQLLLGTLLGQRQSYDEALKVFDVAEKINDQSGELFYNRGIVLNALKRYQESIKNYDRAIQLQPDFLNAYLNRGYTKSEMHLFPDAISDFSEVIKLNPNHDQAYFYRAKAYSKINEHLLAIHDYEKIDEDRYHLLSQKIYEKLLICDWSDYEENLSKLESKINEGEIIRNPFTPLLTLDSPELQLEAAKNLSSRVYPENNTLGPIPKHPKNKKIRLAYIASTFNQSSLTYLISGLFKSHDKDKFELIGIIFNSEKKDGVHKSIEENLDQLIDLTGKSDIEIAQFCRTLAIDIAIDLNGLSTDMRIGIFAYRIAPVQINFLGYPGTIGASYYDYLIADEVVIPKENQKFYSEKIIYLPDSYFVNSHKILRVGEFIKDYSSLEKLGIPNDAFIFCCFNNSYKINPEMFSSWIRILKQVDNSVLWLVVKNDCTRINLIKEAKASGLNETRLIFTKYSSFNDYLSWFQYPDLFLDTFPYTSHTVATDALWMGLPIITKIGNSFVSGVCSSFLKSLNLEELIVESMKDYESLAIDLALNKMRLFQIREKLHKNKISNQLFDSGFFTKNLESILLNYLN